MSLPQTHSFSVENNINPNGGIPFGAKYRGTFTIRRQSLFDKTMISQKDAAERNAFGPVSSGQIPPGIEISSYVFHAVTTLAVGAVPEWFDRSQIFDESDEAAFFAVWKEVRSFQDSFRPATDGRDSGGAGQ